jgi:hypothetical protein
VFPGILTTISATDLRSVCRQLSYKSPPGPLHESILPTRSAARVHIQLVSFLCKSLHSGIEPLVVFAVPRKQFED